MGPKSAGTSLPAHQQIKWAGNILDRLGCHLGVNRRCLQLGMPQQHLDHPDVCSTFEQMRGKAVPERVWGDTFFLISAKSRATPKARLN